VEKGSSAAVGLVLIVDDDQDSRFIIGKLMELRLHCNVVLAESVQDALVRYDSGNFDIIVSDYEMPRRTGLDFAKELSVRNCSIPFLIYSARCISKWELQKLPLIADVVSKPNIDDLFSIISTLMDWPLVPSSRHSETATKH
jgi:CheY-like chemotaxis protein